MPALADKKNKRRATKVVALAAALVVAGGAAFAWWTAGGAGNGLGLDRQRHGHHHQPDQHGRRSLPGWAGSDRWPATFTNTNAARSTSPRSRSPFTRL